MATNSKDVVLSEKGDIENSETSFYNANNESQAFLPEKSKVDVEAAGDDDERMSTSGFSGLTREELDRFATDPTWVKIRWVLFIILLIGWIAMLVVAIVLVVVAPKCPPNPDLMWYEDGVVYKVVAEKFLDADGDRVGDLAGIKEKLDHLKGLSVKSIYIDDVVSGDNPVLVQESVGTMDDFKQLAAAAKEKDIRIILDVEEPADDSSLRDVVKVWTDAGAEGFVVSGSGEETVKALQDFLDETYNKKDDRNRVIIGNAGSNASSSLNVRFHDSMFECPTGTSDWQCVREELVAASKTNAAATSSLLDKSLPPTSWNIIELSTKLSSSALSLALKLTMPGTPSVNYGDEIGLNGDYMIWNDTASGGFTANKSWANPNPFSPGRSVLAQMSEGFDGVSIYSLFKQLAAARAEQHSLRWGDLQMLDFGEDVISFVRNATSPLPPVVVAINTGNNGVAGSLVFEEYTMGKVLVVSGVDVEEEKAFSLSAVYLPPQAIFVAEMSQAEDKK